MKLFHHVAQEGRTGHRGRGAEQKRGRCRVIEVMVRYELFLDLRPRRSC
jgi:hypothetical protein